MMNPEDFANISQLMYRYARAVDKRDAAVLSTCYAPEVELIVPGVPTMSGPDICETQTQGMKDMFKKTQHRVNNIIFDVSGDTAEGEVYCSALHLMNSSNPDGDVESPGVVLEWLIRYQDQLVRQGDDWRIARRELIVDWQEQRSVYVS